METRTQFLQMTKQLENNRQMNQFYTKHYNKASVDRHDKSH